MKIGFLFIFLLFLTNCGKEDGGNVTVEAQTNDVGPFSLKLSSRTIASPNKFSVNIAQDSGRVDFILEPAENTAWMKITNLTTNVIGCDPAKVKIYRSWYAYSGSSGKFVDNNKTFSSKPNEKGTLAIIFDKTTDCTKLEFSMTVEHITDFSEIPKKWELSVDPMIMGKWQSEDQLTKLNINNSYLEIQTAAGGSCFLLSPSPLTDSSQNPRWLSNSDLMCSYKVKTLSNENFIELTCHSIDNWPCSEIVNVKMIRP